MVVHCYFLWWYPRRDTGCLHVSCASRDEYSTYPRYCVKMAVSLYARPIAPNRYSSQPCICCAGYSSWLTCSIHVSLAAVHLSDYGIGITSCIAINCSVSALLFRFSFVTPTGDVSQPFSSETTSNEVSNSGDTIPIIILSFQYLSAPSTIVGVVREHEW